MVEKISKKKTNLTNCEICAGIVLYNPSILTLKKNISSIHEQVSFVFLQDNGSDNIKDIKMILEQYSNVILLENNINKGIAWALNNLCKCADKEGFKWILTLDQDSICPENYISLLYKNISMDRAAIICPMILDINAGKLYDTEMKIESVDQCITSGNILYINAWKSVDGFDNKMFIDGVDFEFCYRLKRKGWNIYRDNRVILTHEIGEIQIRHFLFWKVIVKNHSSFRKYYIAKNIIYMAKKRKNIYLIIKSIFQEIKLVSIVFLYEKDKVNKISSICRGIKDGIRVKVGY